MPVEKKRFYGTKDIMEILGVSRTKAYQIMHGFESEGKVLKIGEKIMRVEIATFNAWVKENMIPVYDYAD